MVEEKKKEEVELVEVPATLKAGFKLPDGTVVSMEEYLVWIGQKVDFISKNVG